ncbi:MAG: inositol monophosphatase [Candidatus Omnitrophica bacterium]|nr:inositol monophosphatase [Candidatus Omnitrophota bacterium]
MSPKRGSDSDRFLPVAVKAARAAGSILIRRYGKLTPADVSAKGDSDWVTTIDHASEREIIRILMREFPRHTVKAEESSPRAPASPYQWLIDPLDGTSNYIHQFPAFCVSVALQRRGRLEVGVVYDPVREELFTARRGHGARLNGRRIRVSRRRRMAGALLTTGFPVRAKRQLGLYLESFHRIFLKTPTIRRAGSAALDLAYTACGRADGFWEMALAPWDMAAGVLLIEEAGGRVSDFFGGKRYLEEGHIAAGNPAIHREIVRVVAPIFRGKL